MKISVLLFHNLLFSILAFAQSTMSQISQMGSGEYQISYPNMVIKVYFDYRPINGLQHITSKTELGENEQYALVQILKNQIDQYPSTFINKYLDIDIIPMDILNDSEFGYNLDHQIIVEAGKIKQGMSYRNSLKSALAHQIAYLLVDDPQVKDQVNEMKTYLNSMHQTYYESNKNDGYSIYDEGYVSRYANGEITGHYSASLEFAELFAHLTCEENRQDLLDFADNHPDRVLAAKVRRFEDFLSTHIYKMNAHEINFSSEPSYTTPEYSDVDGEVLLNIHELRSYESMDFDAIENEDNDYLGSTDDDIYEELPTKSWDEGDPDMEYRVFKYSFEPDRQDKEKADHKTQKKRKKKNGTGLMITGAALYVLLQLLK
jgi:hypothetical protein